MRSGDWFVLLDPTLDYQSYAGGTVVVCPCLPPTLTAVPRPCTVRGERGLSGGPSGLVPKVTPSRGNHREPTSPTVSWPRFNYPTSTDGPGPWSSGVSRTSPELGPSTSTCTGAGRGTGHPPVTTRVAIAGSRVSTVPVRGQTRDRKGDRVSWGRWGRGYRFQDLTNS